MNYPGLPSGMWLLFHRSFRKKLISVLGFSPPTAAETEKKARTEYRAIIARLPEFEKGDRFKMNILSCATLSAFLLSMERRPTAEALTDYYARAMMTPLTRWFCRESGKKKFTAGDIRGMKKTAALRAADRNPYSWNMDFLPYADGSGYEARFTKCGICALMGELGLAEFIPAMCRLDYDMAEAGGTFDFVRENTLAVGGPCCDCGYKRRKMDRSEKSNRT